MENVGLVVNTVSSYSDLWKMFFGQLEKHFPNNKVYVFTDVSEGLPNYCIPILYNPKNNFRTQYLTCIKQVPEKFVIYLNDDYILYDNVNVELINQYVNIMNLDNTIAFIKTNRNNNTTSKKYNGRDDLYYLSPHGEYFFSQNVAIWRTDVLTKIHELGPDWHIANTRGMQFEHAANDICKNLKINGLYAYHGEPKRGVHHYDSIVFPYIASAIIIRRWNIKEYSKELIPLLNEYGIDLKIRGGNL